MHLPLNVLRRRAVLLLLPVLACASATARAADSVTAAAPTCLPRNDELWLISTRHCSGWCGCTPDSCELDVRRCEPQSGWEESTLAALLEGDQRPTVVYAHGNRVDWSGALRQGRLAYESLVACGDAPSLRFVIWSWPSDQVRHPLRDVRVKADRADVECSYFGWFLSQWPAEKPLGLVGYSYGARIISGGLHLLGGGELHGHAVPRNEGQPPPRVHAAYLAPAFDNEWICQGHCHGQGLSAVEQLLILYNTCDPTLSRFRWVDRCTKPTALGHVGIHPGCLGEHADRVEQIDVAGMIGKTHDERAYWCTPGVVREICRVTLGSDRPAGL